MVRHRGIHPHRSPTPYDTTPDATADPADPAVDPLWLWVVLLDPTDRAILLNQTFAGAHGAHPVNPAAPGGEVDTAVRAVQHTHPQLIVMFGGYWGWSAPTAISQSLQALAEIDGFEQSSIPGYPDPGCYDLSYVGTTSRSDRYAATSAQKPRLCSNTVNVACEPIAIIDQDGWAM